MWNLLRSILRNEPEPVLVPRYVLLETGHTPGDDEPSRRLGVVRYMTRPIKREELFEAIAQVGRGSARSWPWMTSPKCCNCT